MQRSVRLVLLFLCIISAYPVTLAQIVSHDLIPKAYPLTARASIAGASTDGVFLVTSTGHKGVLPGDYKMGYFVSTIFHADSNGRIHTLTNFNSSAFVSWGLGGWSDEMRFKFSSHPGSTFSALAWDHQRFYLSDVPPLESGKPISQLAMVTRTDLQLLTLIDSSLHPHVAIGKSGDVHLVWERQTPFLWESHWSSTDSNFSFVTAKIFYQRYSSDYPVDTPTVIGSGFDPKVVLGPDETLHIVWLHADSSTSESADIFYRTIRMGIATEPETLLTSLPLFDASWPGNRLTHFYSLLTDSMNQIHVSWIGRRQEGARYWLWTLERRVDGSLRLDSLPSLSTKLLKTPEGVFHALWSSYDKSKRRNVLHYASTAQDPPFSNVRTFASIRSDGKAVLVRNSRGVLHAVTNDSTTLGFIPDLVGGLDTLIPFGIEGYYPEGDFAALDGRDHFWFTYSRSPLQSDQRNDSLYLVQFEQRPLGITEPVAFPGMFALLQNFPNPFNPTTTISFTVSQSGPVKLIVFDMLGRLIATPVDEVRPPGSYKVEFDAGKIPTGVYYYRLVAGGSSETRKMVLLR